MGPTAEVLLESTNASTLDSIDSVLKSLADEVVTTRKGRVWSIHLQGRPFHVNVVDTPAAVELSAGCNEAIDYQLLQKVSEAITRETGGLVSNPEK